MDLRFVEVDELLDRVNALFYDSDEERQAGWRALESAAWLYHELHLEGVAVRLSDIERALRNEEGADYCDRVLLEQIRRAALLLEDVRRSGENEEPLRVATLTRWHRQFTGEPNVIFRTVEGATEHYKHDVALPAKSLDATEAALSEAEAQRQDAHPLRVSADLVYQLGKAWPFMSWSGACARMAASAVLIGGGYPPLVVPARERVNLYQAYHYDPTRMETLVLSCMESHLRLQEAYLQGSLGASELGIVEG